MSGNRVFWTDHKGKKILIVDYSHTSPEEAMPIIAESSQIAMEQEKGSVLFLADVTKSEYNKESWQAVRMASKDITPYIKAWAVVGVEGAKKFLLKVVGIVTKGTIKEFRTQEEAKNWLAGLK